MLIREYEPSDCKEIVELFYHTVHTVNAKDYTEEQLNVWVLSGKLDAAFFVRLKQALQST